MAVEHNGVREVVALSNTSPCDSAPESTNSTVAQTSSSENRWTSKLHAVSVHLPLGNRNVKAFVSVGIGKPDHPTFIFHGCKVIQQPNQKAYVRLPDRKGDDGRWRPVVESNDLQFKNALSVVVLAAYQEALHGRA